jgi:hypothetical protein
MGFLATNSTLIRLNSGIRGVGRPSELRDLARATTLKVQLQLKTPKLTVGRTSITSRDSFDWSANLDGAFSVRALFVRQKSAVKTGALAKS